MSVPAKGAKDCGPHQQLRGRNPATEREDDLAVPESSPLASRAVREQISVDLSHPVCGNLLWEPQETDTMKKQLILVYRIEMRFLNHVFPQMVNQLVQLEPDPKRHVRINCMHFLPALH